MRQSEHTIYNTSVYDLEVDYDQRRLRDMERQHGCFDIADDREDEEIDTNRS